MRLREGHYGRWEFEDKGEEFQVHVKEPFIYNDSILMKDAAMDGLGIIYTVGDGIKELVATISVKNNRS